MKVADIRDLSLELKNAGLNPTEIKRHPWGADVIYLYDPEGNRLEFWSEIIQAPGFKL